MYRKPDPREWMIDQDSDGFYIVNEDLDDVAPSQRYTSMAHAKAALRDYVFDYMIEVGP